MTSTAKSSVRRVLAMLMSVLAVGCGSFWGRDCGEQPDHPSAYPDPEFSDEILEVDHDALVFGEQPAGCAARTLRSSSATGW